MVMSERVGVVVRWFGIEERGGRRDYLGESVKRAADGVMPLIAGGKVVLVTGASGSGKSSLLREVRGRLGRRGVDVGRVRLRADVACVDCLGRGSVEEVLGELGRLGLGEAWTYVLRPSELSEGQRWRLRLAVGMRRARGRSRKAEGGRRKNEEVGGRRSEGGEEGGDCGSEISNLKRESGARLRCDPACGEGWEGGVVCGGMSGVRVGGGRGCVGCGVVVADEFGAVLDRVTAKVVARCLRRAVSSDGRVGAVVATAHDDLYEALGADVVVRCDFGEVEVVRH